MCESALRNIADWDHCCTHLLPHSLHTERETPRQAILHVISPTHQRRHVERRQVSNDTVAGDKLLWVAHVSHYLPSDLLGLIHIKVIRQTRASA